MTLQIKIAAQDLLKRNEMLQLALRHDGAVFGGYLRDLVSGLTPPPSDVDVWFPTAEQAGHFVLDVATNRPVKLSRKYRKGEEGYGYEAFEDDGYSDYAEYGGDDGNDFKHYRLEGSGLEVYIDVVVRPQVHPIGTDIDVNAFVYDKTGLWVASPPGWPLDLFEVIGNARAKQFVRLPQCRDHRYERAIKKGWTPLNGYAAAS